MFDDSKVSYTLEVCEEFVTVRGNAMASGDADFDWSVEDSILERLEEGDVWAWASVKVTATYDGVDGVEGTDYLGCCSYADEEDFKSGGYYDIMKEEARCALYDALNDIVDNVGPATYKGCESGALYAAIKQQKPVEVIVIVRGGKVDNVYTDRPANVQIKNFDDDPDCALCTDGLEIGY
jgi:hypothetical protein